MAATTLNDFLTESVDYLVAIVNRQTNADKNYVLEKLISPIKDLTLACLKPGHFYISSVEIGDPFYTNLQNAVENLIGYEPLSSNFDAIIHIEENLDAADRTITDFVRENTMITSPSKDGFSFIYEMTDDENTYVSNMYFKDIHIQVKGESPNFYHCVFENCKITDIDTGSIILEECTFNNCFINAGVGLLSLQSPTICHNNIFKYGSLSFLDGFNNVYANVFIGPDPSSIIPSTNIIIN